MHTALLCATPLSAVEFGLNALWEEGKTGQQYLSLPGISWDTLVRTLLGRRSRCIIAGRLMERMNFCWLGSNSLPSAAVTIIGNKVRYMITLS